MELYTQIENLCKSAKRALTSVAYAKTKQKNDALSKIAELLDFRANEILEANAKDLASAEKNGVPHHMLDRLALNRSRIDGIRKSLFELISLTDPIGSGETWTRPSGITISKVRAPLGVIGIIYEARPNVTVDAAALCLKAGNAVILRGGKEAINSNLALVALMRDALELVGIDRNAISIISNTSHEGADILMGMTDYVDVLIPRGSHRLINAVVEKSKVPVIQTGAGNCHLYIHSDIRSEQDSLMARRIVLNAKCQRPSVCNAIETLVVHKDVAADILPLIALDLKPYNVEFRCDEASLPYIEGGLLAKDEDYATEFDSFILAVKQVGSLDEAIEHINKYNTKHSEAIITNDIVCAERFQREIDAAAVYVNASTRFTDGGEFGFGAEIGISTQKLHARGPMGLMALTTEKYLIRGNGEIRQ